jgi:hypothetical protein
MKLITMRIADVPDAVMQDEKQVFEFKTPADKELFYQTVGVDPSMFMNGDNRRIPWAAWDILRQKGWWHDHSENQFLIWMYPETQLEELELRCRHMDWTYQYSDDHRVWQAGESAMAKIHKLLDELDSLPEARVIYYQYMPDFMKPKKEEKPDESTGTPTA